MDGSGLVAAAVLYSVLTWTEAYLFMDAGCARNTNHHCPDWPGVSCSVTTYPLDCPLQVEDTTELIPSAPTDFVLLQGHQDGTCIPGFTIKWRPPNGSGAKTLKGFQIRVTPIGGPFWGRIECVRYDLTGTNFTDSLIEAEIPFTFDCFSGIKHPGTYKVRLQSLPAYKLNMQPSGSIDQTVTVNRNECKPTTTASTTTPAATTTTTTTTTTTSSEPPTSTVSTPTKADSVSGGGDKNDKDFPLLVAVLGVACGLLLLLGIVTAIVVSRRRRCGSRNLDQRQPDVNSLDTCGDFTMTGTLTIPGDMCIYPPIANTDVTTVGTHAVASNGKLETNVHAINDKFDDVDEVHHSSETSGRGSSLPSDELSYANLEL